MFFGFCFWFTQFQELLRSSTFHKFLELGNPAAQSKKQEAAFPDSGNFHLNPAIKVPRIGQSRCGLLDFAVGLPKSKNFRKVQHFKSFGNWVTQHHNPKSKKLDFPLLGTFICTHESSRNGEIPILAFWNLLLDSSIPRIVERLNISKLVGIG